MKEKGQLLHLSEIEKAALVKNEIGKMALGEFIEFQHELQAGYLLNRAKSLAVDNIEEVGINNVQSLRLELLNKKYKDRMFSIINSPLYDEVRNQIFYRLGEPLVSDWTGWIAENEDYKKEVLVLIADIAKNEVIQHTTQNNRLEIVCAFRSNESRRELSKMYGIRGLFFSIKEPMDQFISYYIKKKQ